MWERERERDDARGLSFVCVREGDTENERSGASLVRERERERKKEGKKESKRESERKKERKRERKRKPLLQAHV